MTGGFITADGNGATEWTAWLVAEPGAPQGFGESGVGTILDLVDVVTELIPGPLGDLAGLAITAASIAISITSTATANSLAASSMDYGVLDALTADGVTPCGVMRGTAVVVDNAVPDTAAGPGRHLLFRNFMVGSSLLQIFKRSALSLSRAFSRVFTIGRASLQSTRKQIQKFLKKNKKYIDGAAELAAVVEEVMSQTFDGEVQDKVETDASPGKCMDQHSLSWCSTGTNSIYRLWPTTHAIACAAHMIHKLARHRCDVNKHDIVVQGTAMSTATPSHTIALRQSKVEKLVAMRGPARTGRQSLAHLSVANALMEPHWSTRAGGSRAVRVANIFPGSA